MIASRFHYVFSARRCQSVFCNVEILCTIRFELTLSCATCMNPTLAMMMGSPAVPFGNLKEFDHDKDRITPYLERLAIFLRVIKVADDDKVPVFLSMIGGPTYDILWSLASPGLPEGKLYAEIVALFKSHYQPKPIIIASSGSSTSATTFLVSLSRTL